MARVKSPSARKHKKIRKEAKGKRQARRTRIKAAKEAILHAGQYAYVSRRLKKRDFRKLWIMRLNAAVREKGITYSQFINKLKQNKVEIDRKVLADLAINHPEIFSELIKDIK